MTDCTRQLATWVFVFGLILVPSPAWASDYSGLKAITYGIGVLIALPLALIAYLLTRNVRRTGFRALVWGPLLALIATPMKVDGSNGALSGTPLLAFISTAFGMDPLYVVEALKALAISIPTSIGIIALYLWAKPGPPAGAGTLESDREQES